MGELTHAGGIVFRRVNKIPRYLIITSKKNPEYWVFPKGHIVSGESAEQAAKREVLEETGIVASKSKFVGTFQFKDQDKAMDVSFFLMEYVAAKEATEDRKKRWCTYEEGLELLTFEDSRNLLRVSHVLVQESKDK